MLFRSIGSELATDQQFSDDPETLDAVLDRIQKAINKKLNIPEIAQGARTSPVAPQNLTSDPEVNWHKLLQAEQTPQNLFNIVFSPKFEDQVLEPTLDVVQKRIEKIKSLFTPSDYSKMQDKISQIRKSFED